MKKLYLLLLLAFTCSSMVFGQRFLEETFSDVTISRNQLYGANFTAITIPVTGSSTLQPLVMDVYEPEGDLAGERPLVIYIHTGNFLPIIVNGGVSGDKADSAAVEICTRLAKMGYVVASIDYRVGWDPFGATQPDRAFSLINAAYRGIQDMRTAIRYFRRVAAEAGNQWRVDTTRITAFGQGTGGYLSLTGAVLDNYLEIPQTQNPPGKFLTDLDGDPYTLEPMVVEAWNGDIYGTSLGIFITGDTFCIPNHVGYSSDFHLSVNLGGAMADISWMAPGDVPMISFHAPNDQFAPYVDDILRVGTNNDAVVQVQGSRLISLTADTFGNNDVFAGIDDEWTDAAKNASARAGHSYDEALFPLVRPQNVFGNWESAPWEWWEPSIFDTIPHPFVAGASIHQVQATFNADMSKAKALAYIDTIIGFVAPRAFRALDLDNWTATSETLSPAEVDFTMSPNPATDMVTFSSSSENPIQSIMIYDASGKMVHQIANIHNHMFEFNVGELPAGIYYTGINFEKGLVFEKLSVTK